MLKNGTIWCKMYKKLRGFSMWKVKKTKDIIIQGIIFSLVPAIFSYLGQSDNVWNYLVKKQYIGTRINISVIKDGCLVFSIVFTFIFLTFNLICSQIRENLYKKEWISFVRFNKEIFVKTLTDALGKEYSNINIRIFIPDKPLLWRIKRIVYKKAKLSFVIKNIEGLANPGITNNLSFEVEPTSQGLVGECYNKKQMLYDDSLETSNETNYNLNGYQINKTNNLKFILVCPLFDINRNDRVTAVVAFDSTDPIKVDTREKKEILRLSVLNYTQQLQEYAPELFRKAGGIL